MEPLFHRAYGDALARLPAPILKVHDVRDVCVWHGKALVTQGRSLAARFACWLLSFPPEGTVKLQVRMEPDGKGEIWHRHFGDVPFDTTLCAGAVAGTVEETVWPLTAISRMDCDPKGVDQVLIGMRMFGLPLPRLLWPKLEVRESTDGPLYRFSVAASTPWGALIGRYEGWLKVD